LSLALKKINEEFDGCDAEFYMAAIRQRIKNNILSGKASGRMLEILKLKNLRVFTTSYNFLKKTLLDTAVSRYLCTQHPPAVRMKVLLDKLNKSGIPMTTEWDDDTTVQITQDNKRGAVYMRIDDLLEEDILTEQNPLQIYVFALRPIIYHRTIDILNFHGVFPLMPTNYQPGIHQCWHLVVDDTAAEQVTCIKIGKIEFDARVNEMQAP
jgi:hypothetical protein